MSLIRSTYPRVRSYRRNGHTYYDVDCRREGCAYSDESGHLFRFVSDTDPTISDSGRSEATLGREQ